MSESWIYRQTAKASSTGKDLWTVGFYDSWGKWMRESDHNTAQSAATHVHWLNGGEQESPDLVTAVQAMLKWYDRWYGETELNDLLMEQIALDAVPAVTIARAALNRVTNVRLIDAAPELLAALKETRDAAAALMRAIRDANLIEQVMTFMPNTYDGFGKRADEAIAKAEKGE